jgi:glycosyltransferase involved in cell wall biosynthesis
MTWEAYAFDRYKRERCALYPPDLSELRCPGKPGLVSIVLPAFNGADMLPEALESICRQTYTDFELIAIDDGSTDETGAMLDDWARRDPRIRVVHQENRKIPRTLSRGFRLARGEYLTWTSCDNRLKPDFLERLVGSLRQHPTWDMVYANIDMIGDDGGLLHNADWFELYQKPRGSEHVHLPADPSDLNVFPNNFVGSAFMYRQRVAWLLGDYSSHRYTCEDYDYWMRVNALFTLRHAEFSHPVYEYRFHQQSLTARKEELGTLALRKKLMVFDDFRRDFYLTPLIWVIEADAADREAIQVAEELRRLVEHAGQLIWPSDRLAAEALPRLWVPSVYVRVGSEFTSLAIPEGARRRNTMSVAIAVGDRPLPEQMDEGWDICLAVSRNAHPTLLGKSFQGWFVTPKVAQAFTAIDIRARSQHLELIEAEAYRPPVGERKVSVVVCSYQRSDAVMRAIESVTRQDFPQHDVEIIVVNNDPEDTTLAKRIAAMRERLFAGEPARLRLISCPLPGLSHARNAGLAEARGQVVAFLDDDAVADDEWLSSIWDAFGDHPDVGVVGGHIILATPEPRPEALEPGAESYWSHLKTEYPEYTEVELWWQFPWGANWAARREALVQAGGFRTRYGRKGSDFGGGEELAAAATIQQLGYRIALAPRAVVQHCVEASRFTWDHVRRTIIAGRLSAYRLQRDLYIPFEYSISRTMMRLMVSGPNTLGVHTTPDSERKYRAYLRESNRLLLRMQWQDMRARRRRALSNETAVSVRVAKRS